MASTRSMRVVKGGGVAVDAGASARYGEGGATRPAYQLQGTGGGIGGYSLNEWLNPASPHFWRLVIVLAAFGYLAAWHVNLGRFGRVRV